MPALISWWTQDVVRLRPAADPDAVAAVGAELLARWTQPHRRYHSTRHLVEVFWALEDLTDAGEITGDQAVLGRLAAWWHDAEYDPAAPAGANEAESARLASVLLPRVGLPRTDVDVVVGLVEMTVSHAVHERDPLQWAFHDADLWILASPAQRFDAYCAQVREEYAAVPDDLYRGARSRILLDLVAPPAGPYLTDYANQHWAPAAAENVGRELARLA